MAAKTGLLIDKGRIAYVIIQERNTIFYQVKAFIFLPEVILGVYGSLWLNDIILCNNSNELAKQRCHQMFGDFFARPSRQMRLCSEILLFLLRFVVPT